MDLTLFSRCVLAGLLASSVEIAFFSLTGLELGRLVVLTHLAWLAGAGTVTGMVAWVSNESLVARLWFVVPSLVALLPLLSRRFGTAAMALAMMLAAAWVVAGRFRPKRESVLMGGLAGAILAARVGVFLFRHYNGWDTAWRPLLELAATSLIAILVFFWLPRLERIPRISTPQ